MVHLATLIHDDIIDEAKTRRGNPTVNAVWGDKIAILLGDYYLAKTAGLIADVEDFRIDHLFSDTVATVCEGTILEIMTAGRIDLTVETYYEKIKHKTACLIAACSKGGAIVSGATDEEIDVLDDYGINLGIAFQIIDDILDYTEDQSTIGKPAGNDLRQGMVTLPLIYALQEQPHNGLAQKVQPLCSMEQHQSRRRDPGSNNKGNARSWHPTVPGRRPDLCTKGTRSAPPLPCIQKSRRTRRTN